MYYRADLNHCGNVLADPIIGITACQELKVKEFSQEVRLSSDFDGMVNFVLGGFYGTGNIASYSASYLLSSASPDIATGFAAYFIRQKGWSRSVYGQFIFKPLDTIVIDVGGRYSQEAKRLPSVFYSPSPANILNAPLMVRTSRRKVDDFSPEVTASWHPSQRVILFGSYKEGFLSGGFNVPTAAIVCSSATTCPENSYNQQTIRGFQAGLKAQSADMPVSSSLTAILASDVRWSSDFLTDLSNDPRGRQPSYTLLDASLTLKLIPGPWQFAFIGRNLTGTYYYTLSIADPFSGNGTRTSAGVVGDRLASLSRGRELMFRLSYRFSN